MRRRIWTRADNDGVARSEELFALLDDAVSEYGTFLLDVNATVLTWNAGAERIKGYRSGEIIGRTFSTFYAAGATSSVDRNRG